MVEYFEYEIQVLGLPAVVPKRAPKRKPPTWIWVLVALLVVIILGSLCAYYYAEVRQAKEKQEEVEKVKADVEESPVSIIQKSEFSLHYDEINDVPVYIFHLVNMQAELTLDISGYRDSTECIIVQAADIRRDNGLFVGDFVLDGQRLSSGKRKKGYCAVIDGKVSIGVSEDDEVMNYCIENKGSFFRQYPLVVDGEIYPNELRGKAIRKALVRQENDLYIVVTETRESLSDFSQLLCDIGINDALYLVGGDAYLFWRQGDEVYESNEPSNVENQNYLVFRKRNK